MSFYLQDPKDLRSARLSPRWTEAAVLLGLGAILGLASGVYFATADGEPPRPRLVAASLLR